MDEILAFTRTHGASIMNASIMFIGIFASFLSASLKKRTQVIGLLVLACVYFVLTWLSYSETKIYILTVIVTIIWVAICLFLIWKRDTVSRRKLDKLIRKFTSTASRSRPICIFGGDLDFFGNVKADNTFFDNIFGKNKNIKHNKQFNQLVQRGFSDIRILSSKPIRQSEFDAQTRLRIGYLADHFKDSLQIKFFEEKECADCQDRDKCLACEFCLSCPENKRCLRNEQAICSKLKNNNESRCYNPDTQLRGRIVSRKSDGSICAAIVTTYSPGKTYLLKEYSSNTKECTIYNNIWNVWWKKCKSDDTFISQCIEEYKDSLK